ncbi:hypothetical protein G3O08_09465 [Cryomorpha ignava]|uniref:Dockerin domain-containing protein n=1 Tax=Cryomorpha ignava TaxID=101383 RepID=A0A7K3WQ02_9FLAO|nr:dockerin type I domain-containing protein [Cryomorpha ignava]NEN23727.1 hypothetical protein [Cryomorpha ignava]
MDLNANIGDICDDNNAETENDVITEDCQCVGTPVHDCPDLEANIGDPCDDGNENTVNDVITDICNCEGTANYDCEGVLNGDAVPGSICTVGGVNGFYNESCECEIIPFGSMTIQIEWNTECGSRIVTVIISNQNIPSLSQVVETTIGANGNIVLPQLPTGTYDISITVEGYLTKSVLNMEVVEGMNYLAIGALVSGDQNGDNVLNLADISAMNSTFGSNSNGSAYNCLADLNCDGNINIIDISIINMNFGLTGDGINVQGFSIGNRY